MPEIIAMLEKLGAPAGWAALIGVLFFIARELKMFETLRGQKSEREMMSLDEASFRREILEQLRDSQKQRERLTIEVSAGKEMQFRFRKDLEDCEIRSNAMAAEIQVLRSQLEFLRDQIVSKGLAALISLGGMANMPGDSSGLIRDASAAMDRANGK